MVSRELVLSGGDVPEVREATEHARDGIALPVAPFIELTNP